MKVRIMRIAGFAAVCAVLALGSTACDSSSDSSGGTDVAQTTDTGTGGDAQLTDTGGGTPDTGGGVDDTGGTADTGGTPDTGPPVDTGPVEDTGGTPDTGPVEDTGTPPVEEGFVCGEMLLCAGDCAAGDAACIAGCADQAKNAAEATEFGALIDCFSANCAGVADGEVQACLGEKCTESFAACTAGDGTCAHIWFCDVMCVDDDCRDACAYLGDAAAQGTYGDLQVCLVDKCPSPVAQGCRIDKIKDASACKAQGEACSPPGNKTCTVVFDECVVPCEGDSTCIYNCLVQAKLEDQLAAARYWECLEQVCGPTPDVACKDFAKNHDCSSLSQECTGL